MTWLMVFQVIATVAVSCLVGGGIAVFACLQIIKFIERNEK